MADPEIPSGIRVQSVWQGNSGLPEDRYVNTFAFNVSPEVADATDVEAAIQLVREFWIGDHAAASGVSLASYIPAQMVDAGTSEIRGYLMGDPPPRAPIVEAFGATLLSTSDPIPAEVAVCASFYVQTNRPGWRGRIYLGPLNRASINILDGKAVPHPEFIGSIVAACEFLAGDDVGPVWSLLATYDEGVQSLRSISHGWVDNEFDTQRRRGGTATSRSSWGPA